MQSQAPINDDGREIIIPQIRFEKKSDETNKKFSAGCSILFGLLFFGGGGIASIALIASGRSSVSVNGIPLGVVGGIIFCLVAFGYCIFQFFPAIETLFGASSAEPIKSTNCVISVKGIILHDENGSKYILKWSGIARINIVEDIDKEMYVSLLLSDRRYVAACKHTNYFISMKYSYKADLTLPESSLSMSAKDFTRLLIQRANSQGTQLTAYNASENLGSYAVISSNPELDALHEASLEERRVTGLLLAGIFAACAVIGLFFYIGDKYGFIALLAAIVIIPILITMAFIYISERINSR